ncbi:MAG: hypothetical protein GXP37_12060 [Chloroflexi bacterium]|nr:hypothetical protein [Chloroflexota bacterium]
MAIGIFVKVNRFGWGYAARAGCNRRYLHRSRLAAKILQDTGPYGILKNSTGE